MWPVSPNGYKIDFWGYAIFENSCMIFRYYTEIHFYTRFLNQIDEKKFFTPK